MAEGLTINQQANDDEILTLKSSDVSHGVDGVAESDTYGLFRKYAATQGGLEVLGIGEIEVALQLTGISTSADTGKTTGDNSPVKLIAQLKSGTGVTDMSANGNLVTIANNATTRFIFDAEGSGHADIEWVAFDSYDDLALVTDMERFLTSRESEMGTYNRHALEEAGIIGRNSWHFENGRPRAMVNFTRLAMVHNGVVMQMGQRIRQLEGQIDELQHRLEAGRN